MLNVVLITPRFSETGGSAGHYTHALAQVLCRSGIACDVICSRTQSPRPGYQESGLMRVHRLSVRKGTHAIGFAAYAARRVHELLLTNGYMPVLCIDSPQCAVLLRSIHGTSLPTTEIQVEGTPQTKDPVLLKSIPIAQDLWSPPIFPNPTIMMFGTDTPVDRATAVESYRASGARSAGWSLAMLESDGTWMIREHAPDAPRRQECILVTLKAGLPVLPTLASQHQIASIIHDEQSQQSTNVIARHRLTTDSLANSIELACQLHPDQRASIAGAMWNNALITNSNDTIVNQVRSLCRTTSSFEPQRIMRFWKNLEHQLTPTGIGADQ